MLLNFNIEKAISASGFLIKSQGGSESMFVLVKKLYYADRLALIEWGQSITGDKLASLEKGPIVSGIYDLLKGKGTSSVRTKWDEYIERQEPNKIRIRKEPDMGLLSDRERRVLDEAQRTIRGIRGSIADWLHVNCPEWKDPGKSSSPIDPSTILRLAQKSEADIRNLEEANEEIRGLELLLSTH